MVEDRPERSRATLNDKAPPLSHETYAKQESDVLELYENEKVAEEYVAKRFQSTRSRLLHRSQVRVLNDLIAQRSFRRILEVAPGPARLTVDIDGVRDGVMVEGSAEMVEVARRNLEKAGKSGNWGLRHGNAFELDSLEERFDFAFTFRFIRHFETDDRRRLYEQFSSVLEPGGLLCFDVVNDVCLAKCEARRAKSTHPDPDALRVYDVAYSESSFRAEMEKAGFDVVAMHQTIRHMTAQDWVSLKIGPRIPTLASILVNCLERVPTANPLEWVAVCRKRD